MNENVERALEEAKEELKVKSIEMGFNPEVDICGIVDNVLPKLPSGYMSYLDEITDTETDLYERVEDIREKLISALWEEWESLELELESKE